MLHVRLFADTMTRLSTAIVRMWLRAPVHFETFAGMQLCRILAYDITTGQEKASVVMSP